MDCMGHIFFGINNHWRCLVWYSSKKEPMLNYENVYLTANRILDELAFKTAKYLAEDGFYSLPIPASQLTDEKIGMEPSATKLLHEWLDWGGRGKICFSLPGSMVPQCVWLRF